jgi:hypothetical protein
LREEKVVRMNTFVPRRALIVSAALAMFAMACHHDETPNSAPSAPPAMSSSTDKVPQATETIQMPAKPGQTLPAASATTGSE